MFPDSSVEAEELVIRLFLNFMFVTLNIEKFRKLRRLDLGIESS